MRVITILLFAVALSLQAQSPSPSTIANDDSCDIGVFPAATLLLPYFEVDVTSSGRSTTIFTITNTDRVPHAVRVTLWTDYAYPVFAFPVYLTGYDVQVINLFDVIARGQIAPEDGSGADVSPVGEFSGVDGEPFANRLLDEDSCNDLVINLPNFFRQRIQSALHLGRIPAGIGGDGCENIGGVHANATGYVTVDVVGSCTVNLPTDPGYFTTDIRHANVLTGDYQQIDAENNFAQGGSLVHIRAITSDRSRTPDPEFPRTFYSHLQPAARRTADRRQPLPSVFGARWIAGGGAEFETFFKIWRGVETGAAASCAQFPPNQAMPFVEVVRFDEEENPDTYKPGPFANPPITFLPTFPATSLVNVNEQNIPRNTTGALGGWVYFNLHDSRRGSPASQAWVTSSMRSENRFSVDMDAISLGNGCTPPAAATTGGQP